jgi:hypothetical protein
MKIYVVLQQLEDEDPMVFAKFYKSPEEAHAAIRAEWLTLDNINDHNARIVSEGENYVDIALGDLNEPTILLTIEELTD